ncbi:cytochrome c [Pelagovum sp. HNIBRBA483]|uniref:c-type cytochrome n=1 Tax=Pelagovum sp. HNIBRBA483 TaxID=3233341 RepID=UPI0034A519F8
MAKVLRNLCLALALAAPAGVAVAESHIDPAIQGAITARQSHMRLYAHNLGIVGAMAQGNAEYDAERASAAASNILALSQLMQGSYWAPGSDNASVEGTRALPAIWANIPDVIEKAEALTAAAEGLAANAGTDLASLQSALGAVGGACGACHRAYRQSN